MKVIYAADSAELQEDYYRTLEMGMMYWRLALMAPAAAYNRAPLSGDVTQFIRASGEMMSHIGEIMSHTMFNLTFIYSDQAKLIEKLNREKVLPALSEISNSLLNTGLDAARFGSQELEKQRSKTMEAIAMAGDAGRQVMTQSLSGLMNRPSAAGGQPDSASKPLAY